MKDAGATLYLLGDGDKIRDRIELCLFTNDLRSLHEFSRELKNSLELLAQQLSDIMGASVIMAGGDDLLASTDPNRYSRDQLAKLSQDYLARTGSTISFGVGPTIDAAYLNLRRAKATGGGKIIEAGVTA